MLERQRHVESAPPRGAEAFDLRFELRDFGVDPVVSHVLARFARKFGVYERRFAMRNGIADDGVSIWHAGMHLVLAFRN
jgi:hypothetical protein